jgi:allantoinase
MPGLIDSHVHINEPGRTDWEGFESATYSAAAGGITTLIDMPLNSSPVTTTKDALETKIRASEGKLFVNCGFWGGITPESIQYLDKLLSAGVMGIKAFLTHSGIDEFPNVSEIDLRKAMPILKKHDAQLLVHCELEGKLSSPSVLHQEPSSYAAYLASRPKEWEDNAIKLLIQLCEEFRVKTHIVHLSSSNSIQQIQNAKEIGLPLTVETCPHYIVFNAEEIPDGETQYKCAPPIREKVNNELLWNAIEDGLIDFIVTDHSPAPPAIRELTSRNLLTAWGGIASLQFSLSAFWTEARKRNFTIEDISKLMSANVAKFLQLSTKKGSISIGYDADITIWNPESSYVVDAKNIFHKHAITPYLNQELYGIVIKTYVGGTVAFDPTLNQPPNGQLILK